MLVSFELTFTKVILFPIFVFFVRNVFNWAKQNRMAKKLEAWNAKTPCNTVILHGIPRTKSSPNFSPFVLKVETFLKASKIPYQFDTTDMFGPKEKIPWISYNGVHIGDSHLIIQYLKKEFPNTTKFGNEYSDFEKAVARTARITMEEHFFWGYASWMWIDGFEKSKQFMTGLGRHTPAEFREMMKDDIKSVSALLGNKRFLLGDKVCDDDFAIFGFLANCLWGLSGSPYEQLMTGELINLHKYCIRMKEEYWPDWNDYLVNDHTKIERLPFLSGMVEIFFKKT